MRINQFIARCGVTSRRGADKLISSGCVMIDGRAAVAGDQVDNTTCVLVNGKRISLPEDYSVIAYYKPVGVTCSEKDSHAERLVTDEINSDRRLTYAGRLDKDSEGLLILTDDGALINAMMKSSEMHEKEYEVTVSGSISDEQLDHLSRGIYLKELGIKTRPCRVRRINSKTFYITLTQGLNRQIRRMCASEGLKVTKLKRTRVMNILLGDLQVGASRKLTEEELKRLYSDCGLHRFDDRNLM
ncbi:MAG: rRNA pseudouridine synthase [Lachnospiraceae bacterium]|nr:rRNA pseudouridine synthase [Lachnospiraceae bacterium]